MYYTDLKWISFVAIMISFWKKLTNPKKSNKSINGRVSFKLSEIKNKVQKYKQDLINKITFEM